jgi:hypothetical protein
MHITKAKLQRLIKEEVTKYISEVTGMDTPASMRAQAIQSREVPEKEEEDPEYELEAEETMTFEPSQSHVKDAGRRTAEEYGLEASLGQLGGEVGAAALTKKAASDIPWWKYAGKGAIKGAGGVAAAATAPIEIAVGAMETENPLTKGLGADYAGRAAKYAGTAQGRSARQWTLRYSKRQKDLGYIKKFMEKNKKTGDDVIRGYGGDYEQGGLMMMTDKPKMHADLSRAIRLNYTDVVKKLKKIQAEKQPLKITPDEKRKLMAQAEKLGVTYKQYVKEIKKQLRARRRKRRLAKK